ncbi:MAG: VOC family protein [Treponema sp.]|jgi:hypothetical protein|nr:VOC family protein [Treponema sp.]
METPIDFNGFIQVAIIVKNIDDAAKAWCELFGVPIPAIEIQEPGKKEGVTYRGKDACYGLKLCCIEARDRGFVVELHEATGGSSTFQEYVDKHGYGVHHLGFEVGDKRNAIINELQDRGIRVRQAGYHDDNSWTIVDSEDLLGVNLNIKPRGK